tara:strand:- start:531 stop:1046 length:516 start_codon:yes stop_codon:yes gene_type:complete
MVKGVKDKEDIVKFGYKIKSKGTFFMDDLYKELYKWFEHYGYDWKEIQYRKTTNPNGSYRLELLWQGEKELDGYASFVIDLHLAADLSDVEVTSDTGQKGKRQKGTIEFRTGAHIKKNIKVWEKKKFGKFQLRLYDILSRAKLDDQKTEAYVEVHKLYDEIKAFMMLYKVG